MKMFRVASACAIAAMAIVTGGQQAVAQTSSQQGSGQFYGYPGKQAPQASGQGGYGGQGMPGCQVEYGFGCQVVVCPPPSCQANINVPPVTPPPSCQTGYVIPNELPPVAPCRRLPAPHHRAPELDRRAVRQRRRIQESRHPPDRHDPTL